jgi:NADH-quinone oxidoreductase subunit F
VRGGWDNLLAVIPGGASVPVIPKSVCDEVLMDFDSLRDARTGLGTAAVIVMDKSTDIIKGDRAAVEVLHARKLRPVHAVPRGTGWMWRVMTQMVEGGRRSEIDTLDQVTRAR